MAGALEGLRVLDFSTLLPGPMATLLLAEAGAEVIKVERPGRGDDMRGYFPRWGEDGASFALLNRGKRSIALDLKSPADRQRLEPLVRFADVLVEQFRPGVMARLGLGYEDVAKVNPHIVYCSISGYGQTGPKREAAGHDINYIGDAGLLSLGSGPPDAPVVPPGLIADIAGGSYPAVINILLALRERDATGRGRHLDIAMAEAVFPFLFWAIGAGQATGRWPGNADALLSGGTPRYRLYPTRDGRLVAAGAIEQKFWEAFCAAIGLPSELCSDLADPEATARAVAAIIASRTAEEWRPVLAKADCCCTIVASLEEAMADPHFAARGLFSSQVSNARGETMTALPVPIAPGLRAGTSTAAPALGADNAALLPPRRRL
jgi:crotonobetainyl-CoA:carnitine CoA-transferase CaiB-like acyl-CoA transferase